jgi:2-polyprenyl-3-methyl-5-hydroxy-6-metoxy-1,4-benzoquinol methylase
MHGDLYAEMFEMEERHWWFQGRRRIVEDLLRRYLPPLNGQTRPRIADLGCGCGMMASRMQARGYDVVGIDGSEQAIAFCSQRGVSAQVGRLPGPPPLPPSTFDAVTLLDVLEHLDEDRATVEMAAGLLKPNGILLCTVPAYQWLWSKRDEWHEHRRRYATPQFRALFNIPTLRLELLSHFNTCLFPLAAAARLAARVLQPAEQTKDLRVPASAINRSLEMIFASERLLLGRLPLPYGLSLAAVARKL